MRDTAGSAAAPAARCRKFRRGSFIVERPFTSFDHLVGAQTRTFLIELLLAVVPDIGCELPVAFDLLPHHEVFAGDFFRHGTLGLEAEGPDLSRRGGPEWLDVEGYKFRIADLPRHAFPQCLDRGSALHHAGTGWKCGGVFGVERRHPGEITLVEEVYPLRVHRLNLGLLSDRRRNERGHQGNHQCNAAHDSLLLT